MRNLDERVGLRPRRGSFPCAWCGKEKRHDMCTGKAVRPNLPVSIVTLNRVAAEVEDCACFLRDHRDA